MLWPFNPLFTYQAKLKAVRREISGKPAGTPVGCIAEDITLPVPFLPSLSGRSITVRLVVVNEAILNTVMKKK